MARIYSESQKDILRQTPIVAMMARMGYKFPTGRSGGIFKSPFREDSSPSFHITHQLKTDLFFDHGGERVSGDSYDFAKLLLEKEGRSTSGVAVWDYLAEFHPGIIPEEKTARRATAKAMREKDDAPAITGGDDPADSVGEEADLSGYVCHSGGANGSDTEWGLLAEKHGMAVRAYWYSEKTPAVRGLRPAWSVELTDEQYEEGLDACDVANRTLRRMAPRYMNPFARHLIARDWMQVKNADAVFAVGAFLRSGIVDGGTGWAVQMAIDDRKPVFFYNQDELQWYEVRYDADGKARFEKRAAAPALTKNFAGVGTRNLSDAGKRAIADVFNTTLLSSGIKTSVDAPVAELSAADGKESVDVWYSDRSNAILSNLNPCFFYYNGKTWNCVEQAFQWAKADRFGDREAADRILASSDGAEIKALGGAVKGFNEEAWRKESPALLHDMVYASCLSDLKKAEALLATGDKVITHKKGGRIHSILFPRVLMQVREEIKGLFKNEHSFAINSEDTFVTVVKKPVQGLRLDSLKKFYYDKKMIPESITDKDLFTVAFTINDKPTTRYAAGNPMIDGGYNLRSADWVNAEGRPMKGLKLFAGHADISVQNAQGVYYTKMPEMATSDTVIVFEGITDYMAWKAETRRDVPKIDVVILNSVSNIGNAEPFLMLHHKVALCLDNDNAGQKATETLTGVLLEKGVKVVDLRPTFAANETAVKYHLHDDHAQILVERKGEEELIPFNDYWEGRLGKGPGDFNDYRVLMCEKREAAKRKNEVKKDSVGNSLKIR